MTPLKETSGKGPAAIHGRTVLTGLGIWLLTSLASCVAAWFIIMRAVPAWSGTDIPTLIYVDLVYAALPLGLWAALDGRQRIRGQLAFRFTSSRDVALALGAWVAFAAAAALLYSAASLFTMPISTIWLTILEKATDMARMPSATALAWGLIVIRVFFLAGFAEELLFRGALFDWMAGRWSVPLAVAATAILFGVEHFYPILMPMAVIYGLAAGWVRWRTGSTFNTWVMHVLTDGLMFWAAFWIAGGH